DVSRRLAIFSASLPDHYETFRPKLDGPNDPTVAGKEPNTYVANERYKNVPGAVFRFGNLPAMINADVHSGEDVILTAVGPGRGRAPAGGAGTARGTPPRCPASWPGRPPAAPPPARSAPRRHRRAKDHRCRPPRKAGTHQSIMAASRSFRPPRGSMRCAAR